MVKNLKGIYVDPEGGERGRVQARAIR